MNNFLLSKVPISYGTLIIECTNRCNAKCDICYQAAGSKGSDFFKEDTLPTDLVKKILYNALEIESLEPFVHFSGGEAFLDLPKFIEICQIAKEAGYVEISATTNAFWAKNLNSALMVAKSVKEAGLTRLEISWDSWHEQYIDVQCINNSIKACYSYGIEIILRSLSTKSKSAKDALKLVNENVFDLIDELVCCPVIPIGRASNLVSKDDILYTETLGSACHHMLNLTVNCFGDVYPCCSGLDQNGNLKFGNVYDHSIFDIAEGMNRSLLLRILVFQGIGSFVPILESSGINIGTEFNTICHLCWLIFSNFTTYKIVHDYFQDLEISRLRKALDSLKMEN